MIYKDVLVRVIPIFVSCLVSVIPAVAHWCDDFAKLPTPKIKVARQVRTDPALGTPMLIIHASIANKDLDERRLTILACHLRAKYSTEKELVLRIFDDHKAAEEFNDTGEGNSRAMRASWRVYYSFDQKNNRELLEWRPDRMDRDKWVTIDLDNPPKA